MQVPTGPAPVAPWPTTLGSPSTLGATPSQAFTGQSRRQSWWECHFLSLSQSRGLVTPEASQTRHLRFCDAEKGQEKRGGDCSTIARSPATLSTLRQSSQEFTWNPERTGSPQGSQPWGSPQDSAFATGSSPSPVSLDTRPCEPLPPPPPQKRHTHLPMVGRGGHPPAGVPVLKQGSHPSPLALSEELHGPPKGPFPQVPDPAVARQHRPLPSTPDSPHHTRTSFSPRLRYNKPLPPTPDLPQPHHAPLSSSSLSRTYRPLPPVPITNPSAEPPPLPQRLGREDLRIQGAKPNLDPLVKTGQSLLPLPPDTPPGPQPRADQQSLWPPPAGVRVTCPLAWLSAT